MNDLGKTTISQDKFGVFRQTKFISLLIIGLFAVGSIQAISFNVNSPISSHSNEIDVNTGNLFPTAISDNVINYSRIMTWGGGSYEETIDMAIEGNFAFVARQDLLIFNITEPTNPYLLTKFECQWGSIIKVFVQDGIACLICYKIGIVMVNVSDPTNPSELGKCGYFDGEIRTYDHDKAEYVRTGYKADNLVFLITEGGQYGTMGYKVTQYLYIFDVEDPLYPIPVGRYTKNNVKEAITVIGDYCYLFLQDFNETVPLSIFKIKNQSKLKFIDEIPNLVATNAEFSIADDLAIAQGFDEIVILDIGDPSIPTKLGSIPGKIGSKYVLSGTTAYVINQSSKYLQIYDVTSPTNPIFKGEVLVDGVIEDIIYQDDYLYVVGTFLQIIDVSNVSGPIIVSKISGTFGPDFCSKMTKKGNYAYILDYKNGIKIVDFNDYDNPVVLGEYYSEKIEMRTLWYNVNLHLAGNFLYVHYDNYLEIIDVTDPANPFLDTEMVFAEDIHGVFVKNKILFVLHPTTCDLYDVSNSTLPIYLSSIEGDSSTQIFADKQLLYHTKRFYSNDITNVSIYDLTDPTNATIIYTQLIDHPIYDIEVRNDYLYLAGDIFFILDASNSSDVTEVSTFDYGPVTSYVSNLIISNDKVYFSDQERLIILDIANQTEPYWYSEYTMKEYVDENLIGQYIRYPMIYEINSIGLQNDIVLLGSASIGIDIVAIDEDNDKLASIVEIDSYGTNILAVDTDADGLSDFYEVSVGLDPLNITDGTLDSDLDGLDNQYEALIGTHPLRIDTDFDGLFDMQELNLSTNPLYFDTDGEGLADGLEINITHSDPLLVDTDSDLIDDFTELTRGLDPTFWSNWTRLFGGYLVPVYVAVPAITSTILIVKKRRVRNT